MITYYLVKHVTNISNDSSSLCILELFIKGWWLTTDTYCYALMTPVNERSAELRIFQQICLKRTS